MTILRLSAHNKQESRTRKVSSFKSVPSRHGLVGRGRDLWVLHSSATALEVSHIGAVLSQQLLKPPKRENFIVSLGQLPSK